MKQTVTANIGGIAFHIDEDAYSTLSTYLREIENHLHDSDSKAEIMQDIEARIAELFKQHLNFSHLEVVNLAMVQDIIDQLGQPEVISDGMEEPQDTENEDNTETDSTNEQPKPAFRKRLYRDIDNQFLSGVCAGLGKYMGVDAIWFKLLFIFFTFFNGVGLLAYIILWIIMQPADTAARRLEMRGIEPSAENIKAEVERQRIYQESHPYKPRRSTGGNIAYGCLIAIIAICLLPLAFILIAIAFGLIVALLGLSFTAIPLMDILGWGTTGFTSSWIVALCALILFLIPIISLITWLVRRKSHPIKRGFWITMLTLWILAFIGTCISGFYLSNSISRINLKQAKEKLEEWVNRQTQDAETWEQWADSIENTIEQQLDAVDDQSSDLSETGVLEVAADTI